MKKNSEMQDIKNLEDKKLKICINMNVLYTLHNLLFNDIYIIDK